MADATTTDKPLANLSATEQNMNSNPAGAREPSPDLTGATDTPPAVQRLRDFEDAEIGKDAVRINGAIERGYGSRFRDMPEAKQRKHAALEKLIVSEQKLADAHTALIQADAEHDAAEDEVAAADEAIADGPDNASA